jgi:acyl-CoA synthetase (NDP forming)
MLYPHVSELLGAVSRERFLEMMAIDMTAAAALPRKYNLPLIVSSFFGGEDNFTAVYRDSDVPVFDSPEKAARGMVTLLRHKEIRERKPIEKPPLPERDPGVARLIGEALAAGRKALDEHEAKQALAAYGVPITREAVASTEDEAAKIARRIGFPVAVKACAWEIMHKSGKGLIALNVATEAALRRAFHTVREAAGREIPILVQAMVAGSREFVAGMTRFPGFGPCVLFGLGGVFAEALKDTVFRSAPLSAAEAEEMLFAIRARELLGTFRGLPPVDSAALTSILQAVGFIALLHPEIAEIDCNPVIIAGSQPVVADALFVLKD